MKKIMISLLTLLLVCGCAETGRYMPDENNPVEIDDEISGRSYSACRLLLTVDEGTGNDELEKLAGRYGMSFLPLMSGTIVILESELPFSARDLAAIRAEIEQVSFVRSAEYDYIIKLDDPITPPLTDI
ncbi:MAG: hypothetical protein IJM79_08440 [Erysipelotrichaceae bacterium]|nr:hypothetical protein [Erysipelotrichaceae bacterium]